MKFSEFKGFAEADDEKDCFYPKEELKYTQYAVR